MINLLLYLTRRERWFILFSLLLLGSFEFLFCALVSSVNVSGALGELLRTLPPTIKVLIKLCVLSASVVLYSRRFGIRQKNGTLDCGDRRHGFARIRCENPKCRHELIPACSWPAPDDSISASESLWDRSPAVVPISKSLKGAIDLLAEKMYVEKVHDCRPILRSKCVTMFAIAGG